MPHDFLLYGSYGYSGRLILERALKRGLRPLLAGRDGDSLAAQAAEHRLDHRVIRLEDVAALQAALREVPAVLHAAGPFRHTCAPMAAACLRTRTHYLDITGEIEVFEALAARDAEARRAGVMLLPGAGFDTVPSDCLAAHLKRRLPTATHLSLALLGTGGTSRGTATTMLENLPHGGAVRRDGAITRVPAAWKTRRVDFGTGPRTAVTIPWGDVSTAFHSTGIPNVEVYLATSEATRLLLIASRPLGRVLDSAPVQRLLRWAIRRRSPGPDAARRARAESRIWGEVRDARGRRAESRLRMPDGYTVTALAAMAVLERVLAGNAPPGFQTPSRAYGPDLVLELDGVTREDLP